MSEIKFGTATKAFLRELCSNKDGRYISWEHCYRNFYNARKNKDIDNDRLALHLAFYLASWGMYRGSSFLLKKDYTVHKKAVDIILDDKYNSLQGITCEVLVTPNNIALLTEVTNELNSYYASIKTKVNDPNNDNISETLITKILLGTLGCVPAYDRYFKKGVRLAGVAKGNYNNNSITDLCNFYNENKTIFNEIKKNIPNSDISYPEMKLIDMEFWQIGYDNDKKNKTK